MDDAQWECALMAADFMHGFHHVSNLRRWGNGIAIDHPGELATFDFNGLTRLVVTAHERCIRAGVRFETREEDFEGNKYEETHLVVTFHKRERSGKSCHNDILHLMSICAN